LNNINALKQYNSKAGELKRLNARLKVIDIKLDNWDKLKAATVSDMPMYHDTENGDKVGKIVASREDLQEERQRVELEIAELNCFIIDIDTRLDCLGFEHRWLLDKKYRQGIFYTYAENRQNKNFYELLKLYNKEINIIQGKALGKAIREAEKAYIDLI
jgi:hypothetical protein